MSQPQPPHRNTGEFRLPFIPRAYAKPRPLGGTVTVTVTVK